MTTSTNDAAEFAAFAKEFSAESDRAAVILGAAKLDVLMFQLLQKVLRPSTSRTDELLEGDSPLGTFSARTLMCHRLGLIDDELFKAINLIRRIRNSFAHELTGVSLETGAHRDRIRELVAPLKEHGAFRWMVQNVYKEKQGPANDFRAVVAVISLRLEGAFEQGSSVYSKSPCTLIPHAWDELEDEPKKDSPGMLSLASSPLPPAGAGRLPRTLGVTAMQVTDSPLELSQLMALQSPRLIAIDGAHGSGKSTLAKTLGQFLDAKVVEADVFLTKHQDSYFPNLDWDSIAKAIDRSKLCIFEGICIRQILSELSLTPDVHVYVKRMRRWGWVDEDEFVFSGTVEEHLEQLTKRVAEFIEPGKEPQLGLWEEVIRYHANYQPHEQADYVFLRGDA